MKKLLSMILALIMVFSLAPMTVSFAEGEGTPGDVVIFLQDFEGTEAEWTKFFTGNMTGVKEDIKIPGNHHSYTTITPESVVYSGATTLAGKTSVADGDFRLKQNAFNYRMTTKELNVPYEYGRSYNVTWKGFFGGSSNRVRAVKNASGIDHAKKWEAYSAKDESKLQKKVGQWYGSYVYWINRSGSENIWETISVINNFDESTGWNTFGYDNIGFGVWDGQNTETINAEGYETDTIKDLFLQWKLYDKLAKLLVDNKAYAGGGFELSNATVTKKDGTVVNYAGGYINDLELAELLGGGSYVFDITAEDVAKYDDMAKVDLSGNKYLPKSAEQISALPDSERYYDKDGVKTEYLPLVKRWHMFEDCTALKSEKKLADFTTVMNGYITEIGVDDVKIEASAMLYDDAVSVSGEADVSITAVTNSYTGEGQTINGSGTIKNVNDYFGTEYTIESNAETLKAVYNGEELQVVNDGNTYSFTIAPEKITKSGSLEVKTTGIKKIVPMVNLTVNEKSTIAIADQGFASGKIELSDMPEKNGSVMLAFYRDDYMEKAETIYKGDLSKKESIDFKVEDVKSFSVKAFVIGDDFQPVCDADEVKLQKPPVVIFKFDDGRPANISQTRILDKSMSYLTSKGIHASVGVLTSSLPSMISNPGGYTEATALYKKWIADGHEMWLHGYDHGSRTDGDVTIYEFEESYEEQKKDIETSCNLMKQYFDYEFVTFGASWNRNNDDTIRILNEEFPQFKTVLFGSEGSVKFNAFNFSERGSMESSTGKASFDRFLSYFNKAVGKDYLVLQAHPPYFDDASVEELKKIVEYLEAKGCEFMTPDEYRRSEKQ